MAENLRLMAVLAHPDDESLGIGGVLARYATEGVGTYLVTATRGERGRLGTERPGAAVLAPIRERELHAAAAVLGVREVHFLDYVDGELAQVDQNEAIGKIAALLRSVRPHVVVTFAADGAYGHPDHIAISQLTGAALVAAADSSYDLPPRLRLDPAAPWRVAKLYWAALTPREWESYRAAFGDISVTVDDEARHAVLWPDWAVTSVVDTSAYRDTIWTAVRCHQSQVSGYSRLKSLPESLRDSLWETQSFYRVFSLVNGGRERETDLLAGLR